MVILWMIWVSICYVAYVGVNALLHMIHFEIVVVICIGKWKSCTKKGFSPFPLPYMETNGCCHHQRRFLNLGRCCHYWFNSYRFGATCFDDDNPCNNNCCSKQKLFLHKTNAKKWFHSPYHRDLWLSPSLFWFLFTSCVHANIACQINKPPWYFWFLYFIIGNKCR